MLIVGYNGVIEFPKTNLFISSGTDKYYIVPVIRSRQWLVSVKEPFAYYETYERAKQVIDDIVTQYIVGKKVFTMP